jgi:hypothetical protein
MGFHQMKKLLHKKGNRMGEISASHSPDRRLRCRIYKEPKNVARYGGACLKSQYLGIWGKKMEFKASLDYIGKAYFKRKKKTQKVNNNRTSDSVNK